MDEILALRKIRTDLVEQRRKRVARRLDNPTAGMESVDSIGQIQQEIDVIDCAIADEQALAGLVPIDAERRPVRAVESLEGT